MSSETLCADRVRDFGVSLEKKRRNLEKRKNKLDEYKCKKNLSKDQEEALSKYSEVLSNLSLIDELIKNTQQCVSEVEKVVKKSQKNEVAEKRKIVSTGLSVYKKLHSLALVSQSEQERAVESNQLTKEQLAYLLTKHEVVKSNYEANCFKEMSEAIVSIVDSKDSTCKPLFDINWDELAEKEPLDVVSNGNELEQPSDQVKDAEEDAPIESVELELQNIQLNEPDVKQVPATTNGQFIEEVSQEQPSNSAAGFNFLHSSTISSKPAHQQKHSKNADVHHQQNDGSEWKEVHTKQANHHKGQHGDVFDSATNSEFLQNNPRRGQNKDGYNSNFRGGRGNSNGFRGGRGGNSYSGQRGNRGTGGYQGRGGNQRGSYRGSENSGAAGGYGNGGAYRNNRQQGTV